MPTSDFLVSSVNYNNLRRPYHGNINRINQRRNQRRRCRVYRRRAPIDNADTLNLIAQLPLQITNDPFVNHLFNGSSFY